jgi:hypothetical protein
VVLSAPSHALLPSWAELCACLQNFTDTRNSTHLDSGPAIPPVESVPQLGVDAFHMALAAGATEERSQMPFVEGWPINLFRDVIPAAEAHQEAPFPIEQLATLHAHSAPAMIAPGDYSATERAWEDIFASSRMDDGSPSRKRHRSESCI